MTCKAFLVLYRLDVSLIFVNIQLADQVISVA